jgi:diacylglycerol kinase family enzyme
MMENSGKREHLFIINPKSFPRQPELDRFLKQIENYFWNRRNPHYFIHTSQYPRHAISIIRKHLSQVEPDTTVRVYAAGGDGIIFDCLNGIVGVSNTELAMLPYGSGSDMVRAFGDEHYLEFRDLDAQVTASAIPTDLIHCGNNCALNFCTIGIEAAAVIQAAPLQKKFEKSRRLLRGLNSFFYAAGGVMGIFNKNLRGQHYRIEADGVDLSGRYNIINIANGPCYALGKSAVITAVPDDGLLDMMVVGAIGGFKSLRCMSDYLRGAYYKHPDLCFLRRVKKVSIRSEFPLWVNLDGEAFFDSGLNIEIIPGAVKIAAVNGLTYHQRAKFNES